MRLAALCLALASVLGACASQSESATDPAREYITLTVQLKGIVLVREPLEKARDAFDAVFKEFTTPADAVALARDAREAFEAVPSRTADEGVAASLRALVEDAFRRVEKAKTETLSFLASFEAAMRKPTPSDPELDRLKAESDAAAKEQDAALQAIFRALEAVERRICAIFDELNAKLRPSERRTPDLFCLQFENEE